MFHAVHKTRGPNVFLFKPTYRPTPDNSRPPRTAWPLSRNLHQSLSLAKTVFSETILKVKYLAHISCISSTTSIALSTGQPRQSAETRRKRWHSLYFFCLLCPKLLLNSPFHSSIHLRLWCDRGSFLVSSVLHYILEFFLLGSWHRHPLCTYSVYAFDLQIQLLTQILAQYTESSESNEWAVEILPFHKALDHCKQHHKHLRLGISHFLLGAVGSAPGSRSYVLHVFLLLEMSSNHQLPWHSWIFCRNPQLVSWNESDMFVLSSFCHHFQRDGWSF